MSPKKLGGKIFGGLFCGSKMLFVFVLFWIASKTCQEGPGGAQEARGSPPECLKRPQEVPKSAPGGSKRASRKPQGQWRALKTSSKAPKSFSTCPQGFSETPGPAAVFGKMQQLQSQDQTRQKNTVCQGTAVVNFKLWLDALTCGNKLTDILHPKIIALTALSRWRFLQKLKAYFLKKSLCP